MTLNRRQTKLTVMYGKNNSKDKNNKRSVTMLSNQF